MLVFKDFVYPGVSSILPWYGSHLSDDAGNIWGSVILKDWIINVW
jgi:hypothetical protein